MTFFVAARIGAEANGRGFFPEQFSLGIYEFDQGVDESHCALLCRKDRERRKVEPVVGYVEDHEARI